MSVNKKNFITISVCFGALALTTACATPVRNDRLSAADTGYISRVEAATIVSMNRVAISGYKAPRIRGMGQRGRPMGLTLILRLERNAEMVSVTQVDDARLAPNQQVWVQFGDRVRVLPR